MAKLLIARVRDDEGFTLVTVIGVMLIITILATSAYFASHQALQDTVRTARGVNAFQAANSGIDAALQRVSAHTYVAGDFPMTGELDDGSSYLVTVTPAGNSNYKCTSVGTDPKGGTATVQVSFFSLNYWNMDIGSGQNALGGGSLHGTSSVYGPLYCRGGLTLPSNSEVKIGPLFVNVGSDPTVRLQLQGSGTIGSQSQTVDVYCNGTTPSIGDNNFYVGTLSNAVPDIALPQVDSEYLTGEYGVAKAQSIDNVRGVLSTSSVTLEGEGGDPATYRTVQPPNSGVWSRAKAVGASSYYKVVGDDSSWGPIVGSGTHPLVIADTSFGSWFGDGHTPTAGLHDDFAYDAANRILYVEGTVFIDGALLVSPAVKYRGNGKIVVNGPITVSNGLRPDTASGFMDSTHVLGLVTPADFNCSVQTGNDKGPEDVPDVCGAFFVGGGFKMTGNGVLVRGSILANEISFDHSNQHLVTEPFLPTYLPAGMPGKDGYILTKSQWARH
jgi:Tfp pilus assembly protein PilE